MVEEMLVIYQLLVDFHNWNVYMLQKYIFRYLFQTHYPM